MTIESGKLRHRIEIQRPSYSQNADTGAMTPSWLKVCDAWASIEPLSVKDFIASQSEQSQIVARITIRYRDDIEPNMRINHNGKIYVIQGILLDKDSGMEYLTLPVSYGVKTE